MYGTGIQINQTEEIVPHLLLPTFSLLSLEMGSVCTSKFAWEGFLI